MYWCVGTCRVRIYEAGRTSTRVLTALLDDAVGRVPLVVAARPGQLVGDGGEEEEERVGDQHVVVRVHQQQHRQDRVANAWHKT